ncbi:MULTISPECIES: YdcF family protein [unclassified Roseibium]|uniref:YdcF family protein n=1 Tax=unclassified Roseibium TaxID=2629323 RepID=UPI00273E33E8|nr:MULTISPECIES: YdcF family protein [unclassified Roseibium]
MQPRQHPQAPADAIVLLGAAVWTGGRPSPTLLRRIKHAAELYQAGAAPVIIGCGGLGNHPPAEAEVMKRELIVLGVPESAIRTETRSRNTLENAVFSARILRREKLENILIVSDRYHLPRAVLCFKTLGFSAAGSGPGRSVSKTPLNRWLYACLRETAAYPLYLAKMRAIRKRSRF